MLVVGVGVRHAIEKRLLGDDLADVFAEERSFADRCTGSKTLAVPAGVEHL